MVRHEEVRREAAVLDEADRLLEAQVVQAVDGAERALAAAHERVHDDAVPARRNLARSAVLHCLRQPRKRPGRTGRQC